MRYCANSQCLTTLCEEFSSTDVSENQNILDYDQVGHDIEKTYTSPKNQDEYEDYINGNSYKIKESSLE